MDGVKISETGWKEKKKKSKGKVIIMIGDVIKKEEKHKEKKWNERENRWMSIIFLEEKKICFIHINKNKPCLFLYFCCL